MHTIRQLILTCYNHLGRAQELISPLVDQELATYQEHFQADPTSNTRARARNLLDVRMPGWTPTRLVEQLAGSAVPAARQYASTLPETPLHLRQPETATNGQAINDEIIRTIDGIRTLGTHRNPSADLSAQLLSRACVTYQHNPDIVTALHQLIQAGHDRYLYRVLATTGLQALELSPLQPADQVIALGLYTRVQISAGSVNDIGQAAGIHDQHPHLFTGKTAQALTKTRAKLDQGTLTLLGHSDDLTTKQIDQLLSQTPTSIVHALGPAVTLAAHRSTAPSQRQHIATALAKHINDHAHRAQATPSGTSPQQQHLHEMAHNLLNYTLDLAGYLTRRRPELVTELSGAHDEINRYTNQQLLVDQAHQAAGNGQLIDWLNAHQGWLTPATMFTLTEATSASPAADRTWRYIAQSAAPSVEDLAHIPLSDLCHLTDRDALYVGPHSPQERTRATVGRVLEQIIVNHPHLVGYLWNLPEFRGTVTDLHDVITSASQQPARTSPR